MKKKLIFAISITAITFTCFNYSCIEYFKKYTNTKEAFNPQTNGVTHKQTMGQVSFFKEALDKLGATSPEQVVKTWAEAEKTRNGVYHYAVACTELKNKIIIAWGKPEENFWVYGGSSPWLDRYEILSNKKLNNYEYEVKIKFYWATSLPTSETTETTLKIVKENDTWCVRESSNY
jgi:hypothetical protein